MRETPPPPLSHRRVENGVEQRAADETDVNARVVVVAVNKVAAYWPEGIFVYIAQIRG